MSRPPGSSNLVALVREVVSRQPDRRAFTFLADGETEQSALTFREVDTRARAIAARLQEATRPGERAILLCPPDLQNLTAFVACLYAGVVAVPTLPVRADRPEPFLALVQDAQATQVLTTTGLLSRLSPLLERAPQLNGLHWLTTDDVADSDSSAWREPKLSWDTLGMLNYTSGSTATPKGVVLNHATMLHTFQSILDTMGCDPEDKLVYWTPLYLGSALLISLVRLYRRLDLMVLMPAMAFMERPIRWLQAITQYQATIGFGSSSTFHLCVDRTSPEERQGLDLSRWHWAICGGEPTRAEVLTQFCETFAPYGFRREFIWSTYQLSEGLSVSCGKNPAVYTAKRSALERNQVVECAPEEPTGVTFVSGGQVTPGMTVRIVDPVALTTCQPDQIGEIWVTGPTVGQGYWNQPEATQVTFQAHQADTGEGPFLRTGDMGFLKEGELYLTGRLKNMIIIRGRNIYSEDIERATEQAHPALLPGGGAAFAIPVDGQEQLAIVHEIQPTAVDINVEQIASAIRRAVAQALQLPVYSVVLVKAGSLPRSPTGKIQRQLCQAQFLANEQLYPQKIHNE